MKILLTNDDGIQAKGIRTLAKVLSSEHEIYIVAPEGERSANSHAITYYRINHEAIREEVDGAKEAWAIVGATPADCTYYALHTILKDREPDLVISGINHGENFSSDCKYSGTVSAAMEGLIAGYPSIATSLCSYTSREFEVAAEVIRDLIPYYMQDELRHEYTLNVNIPSCAKEEIKGFKVTHFDSQRIYEKNIDLMHKEGNRYELICRDDSATGIETIPSIDGLGDSNVVRNGYVSLTPLHLDMVKHEYLAALKGYEKIKI